MVHMDACSADRRPATSPDWERIGGWETPEVVGPFVQPERIPAAGRLRLRT
jgi:hypothetical protein